MSKSLKINIFSLPSHTAVLFWLMTTVLLGAMLLGSSGTSVIPMWPLAVIMLLLPIREFLMRSDRDIKKYGLEEAGERFPILQESIRLRSHQIGLKRFPRLLISENGQEIYEMGSFYRWYIVAGNEKAQTLESLLNDPENFNLAEVQILHELYHFKTGDYWQLGYLTELFKVSFNLMFWTMLFFGAWGFMLVLAKEPFFSFLQSDIVSKFPSDVRPAIEQFLPAILPSPEEIEDLRIKAQELNLVSAIEFVVNITLPYLMLASILWIFYRPLLWRIQEYYADAGAIHKQGDTSSFWESIIVFTQKTSQETISESKKNINHSFFISLRKIWWGDFWPSTSQRLAAIEAPEKIFYDWKQIAWILGSLALALMVFMATPITLTVVGKNPMIFSTLLVVVPLSYFLLPQVVLGETAWKNGLKVLLVILGIHTVWLLLTLALMWGLYFIAPELLREVLQSAIASIARYAGNVRVDIDLLDFLVNASIINLLQVPFVFAFQLTSVLGLLSLFKRVLSWHSYVKTSQDFKNIVFGLTFGVSFVLATLIMPVGMAAIDMDFSVFWGWTGIWSVLGVLLMISGFVWLYLKDRKYYQKCYSCNEKSGLGKKCRSCGATLNPWLWVEYEDE